MGHDIPLIRILQWLRMASRLTGACMISPHPISSSITPHPPHIPLQPHCPTCHSSNTLDMVHGLCSSSSLCQKCSCSSFTLWVSLSLSRLYSNSTFLLSSTLTTLGIPTTYPYIPDPPDYLITYLFPLYIVYCLSPLL